MRRQYASFALSRGLAMAVAPQGTAGDAGHNLSRRLALRCPANLPRRPARTEDAPDATVTDDERLHQRDLRSRRWKR